MAPNIAAQRRVNGGFFKVKSTVVKNICVCITEHCIFWNKDNGIETHYLLAMRCWAKKSFYSVFSCVIWRDLCTHLLRLWELSKIKQPWVFFGRNDAKAETPVLWPPHVKSWLIGKDSDAGRDWGQEEKGTAEDEMAGWHHRPYGHEPEWTPGVGDGQGGLACCDS